MPDPLATLEAWLDDDMLAAAQHVLAHGIPDTESERATLIAVLGEELDTVKLAALQLQALTDEWCAIQHPTPGAHRAGMAELRAEAYDIAKARLTYQRALARLRMIRDRKTTRGSVVDAAVAFIRFDFGDVVGSAEAYDLLASNVADWLAFDAEVPA